MNFIKNNPLHLVLIFIAALLLINCNNDKKNNGNQNQNNVKYFKNIQFNVKGYLTEGFNPLPIEIVKKTDCFRLTYDDQNRVKEVAFVIKDRVENTYLYGFAYKKYEYTDSSIKICNQDRFGKMIPLNRTPEGVAIAYKEIVLKDKMPIKERVLDLSGAVILGLPIKVFECNEQGEIVWEHSEDNFGKMQDISGGAAVYFKNYQYTKAHLVTMVAFYQTKEKKIAVNGLHAMQYEYNEQGNITKNCFLDEQLKYKADPSTGMAYRKMEYNAFGNLIKQVTTDIDDKPINTAEGYAIQINTFDENTNNLTRLFFDQNEKPTINKQLGAHGERYVYSPTGDMVLKEYVDMQQKVTNSSTEGYAYMPMEYNDSGWLVSEAYFTADNKAIIPTRFNAHEKTVSYYPNGLVKQNNYFDENRSPLVLNNCACTSVAFTYDSLGNNIHEVYLDKDGQPTKDGREGIAARKFKYDEFGEVILTQFFDFNDHEITIQGNQPLQ